MMKGRDLWKLSLQNVMTTPMRSLLTVLGMAIGIGAILAVLTLGDAGKMQVESEMMRLGIDKVWITAKGDQPLLHGDAALLSRAMGAAVTEQVYAPFVFRADTRESSGVLVGSSPEYLRIMDSEVIFGRDLWPLEWEKGSRSVLVGEELARELAGGSASRLCGSKLSIGGALMKVVGVVRQSNELSQVDSTRAVFLPISVFCEWMGNSIHELTLSVPKDTMPQAMAVMAMDVLRQKAGRETQAITMQVQIEAANSVMDVFIQVLKWVAAVCILVGGIGVMNILLVSVRERRREIGIMKSLGATSAQIRGLFLLEALLYAVVGGALGIAVGIGIVGLAGSAIGLRATVGGDHIGIVVLAAVAVGLFFGVAPASKASRMTPVDALRE